MLTDYLQTLDVNVIDQTVEYLAQNSGGGAKGGGAGSGNITLDGTKGGEAPQLNIVWPASVISIARVIAVLCAIAWIIFIASKFLAPSSQGNGNLAQKFGGWGTIICGATAIMVLWDLDSTTKVVNAFMRLGYMIWSWLTSGLSGQSNEGMNGYTRNDGAAV